MPVTTQFYQFNQTIIIRRTRTSTVSDLDGFVKVMKGLDVPWIITAALFLNIILCLCCLCCFYRAQKARQKNKKLLRNLRVSSLSNGHPHAINITVPRVPSQSPGTQATADITPFSETQMVRTRTNTSANSGAFVLSISML